MFAPSTPNRTLRTQSLSLIRWLIYCAVYFFTFFSRNIHSQLIGDYSHDFDLFTCDSRSRAVIRRVCVDRPVTIHEQSCTLSNDTQRLTSIQCPAQHKTKAFTNSDYHICFVCTIVRLCNFFVTLSD